MKFQPIERPIDMENDAIPVYLEESGDDLIIGAINPKTNEKQPFIKLNSTGRITFGAKPPFFFPEDCQFYLDIDNL